MNIRFKGNMQRNYQNGYAELKNDISIEVCRGKSDMASCRCVINIVAEEDDGSNSTNIGVIDFYAYSVNNCRLDISAEDFEEFDSEEILYELMDEDSADTERYYYILRSMYPEIFMSDTYEDIIFSDLSVIALHRIYIEPEYRRKGIGKFVASNLAKIIIDTTNIKPLYAFGVIVPDDKTEETRNIQIKTMEDAGFIIGTDEDDCYIFGKCILDEDIM